MNWVFIIIATVLSFYVTSKEVEGNNGDKKMPLFKALIVFVLLCILLL